MRYGDSVFEQAMKSMGLTPRPQQEKLIDSIRDTLQTGATKFDQAGTGTGKSFVLLSAALEAARTMDHGTGFDDAQVRLPAVVICPTNNLIDQYVHKDAPKIAASTGGRITYLKGRNRYLCTASFAMSQEKDPVGMFKRLTKDGKLEWAQHGLDNSYGCSGDCDPDLGDLCAVQIARFEASKAEVIITNGHLLVWDRRIRDWTEGQVGLLPDFGALFVDECHALEEVGRSVLSDQIKRNSTVFAEVPGLLQWVERTVREHEMSDRNREIPLVRDDAKLIELRADALDYRKSQELQLEVAVAEKDRAMIRATKKVIRALDRFLDFSDPDAGEEFISTISLEDQGGTELDPALNTKCVDASRLFRSILRNQPTAMVSGTVPVSLPQRMGVREAKLDDVGTPFNYGRSTLAISAHRGNDSKARFQRVQETVAAVNDMLSRSHEDGGGGSLVLFTSWADLNEVMPFLAKRVQPSNTPVFVQGKDPQENMRDLEAFARHGHAVFGGVTSMWTGVDVPGPALRQVVIFKLPWGVPTLEVKAIERIHGRQPYVDTMLQTLAQGIGRLVRSTEDDGRIYIADSRAKSINWRNSPLTQHISQFSAHRKTARTT